ncbi:hypothetical protein GOODEAATRI_007554 [Goodea atripinnis]|uniref:Secreted protein n=1 Tax=Goodea atripinnis TaxID=208336 RepID=A0ABV0N8R0_9TELE
MWPVWVKEGLKLLLSLTRSHLTTATVEISSCFRTTFVHPFGQNQRHERLLSQLVCDPEVMPAAISIYQLERFFFHFLSFVFSCFCSFLTEGKTTLLMHVPHDLD